MAKYLLNFEIEYRHSVRAGIMKVEQSAGIAHTRN